MPPEDGDKSPPSPIPANAGIMQQETGRACNDQPKLHPMTARIWQSAATPLKRILPRAIWSPARGLATAVLTPLRFSHATGHWRSSLRASACSASGHPLPWYTYPAIDFLAQRPFRDRHVLEFGGGQSTLWWAQRAASVLTVEEDRSWFEQLQGKLGANVRLHHVPADTATRSIAEVKSVIASNDRGKFDVIVVDGHLRRELAIAALDYLSPGGAMLLDNAEGYGFYEALKDRDCRRIDFYGFAPGVSLRHCTSLVYLDDCFLLSPEIPIASIEVPR